MLGVVHPVQFCLSTYAKLQNFLAIEYKPSAVFIKALDALIGFDKNKRPVHPLYGANFLKI